MMFEDDRTGLDRAYVASSVPNEDGVQIALRWCLERTGNDYRKVNLRVPTRRVVAMNPALQQLERAGVAISAESHRGIRHTVAGPMIVLAPSLESLCAAEDEGFTTALVVVGAYGPPEPDTRRSSGSSESTGLLPWVSAFNPEHLAGTQIQPRTPIFTDPVLDQAMDSFTSSINSSSGLTDSRDRSRVTDGLTKLRSSGHSFDPDKLLASALALNWRGTAAWDLKVLAKEINAGVRKRVRDTYRPDIIQYWEQNSAKSD